VEESIWKDRVRENANEKSLGLCYRSQGDVQTTERKNLSSIQEREKGGLNFVKDQLRKGYIRPSKSPQTSPVFFVGKKNSRKRMVMDYRNLNNQTVKNNYLLSLITELIDNMKSKKVFTKMDLRWEFNNVRIKEGDKWKEVFTTHIRSFELMVMFFGMTNLPATF